MENRKNNGGSNAALNLQSKRTWGKLLGYFHFQQQLLLSSFGVNLIRRQRKRTPQEYKKDFHFLCVFFFFWILKLLLQFSSHPFSVYLCSSVSPFLLLWLFFYSPEQCSSRALVDCLVHHCQNHLPSFVLSSFFSDASRWWVPANVTNLLFFSRRRFFSLRTHLCRSTKPRL